MTIRSLALATVAPLVAHVATAQPTAMPNPGTPSSIESPAGPVPQSRLTEGYVRLVARDAYFWAWPLVNMMSRRAVYSQVPARMYLGGAPVAPLNELTMLTDYFPPEVRAVACPNQDVVYGGGFLALDKSAVVIQVPDFGDRFWVYQVVDSRTDGFAKLGKMYATKPGFYLLVGPNWQGEVPKGITQVFRSTTSTGNVIPRVFMDDTPQDKVAVQEILKSVLMYPVDQYDGAMKTVDWQSVRRMPPLSMASDTERQWVLPEKFFDMLPAALKDAPPMPGEAARYAQVLAVVEAAKSNPAMRKAMDEEAKKAEIELVAPLFEFRNFGLQLPNNWSTTSSNAAFGTDYFTRTAIAKSNIFVNASNETKYFYQDLDSDGQRLNGRNAYTVTFAKGATPPVDGFWSVTLYNAHHFFAPNDLKRYSLGTKSKSLRYNADGSLTFRVQASPPVAAEMENWLPAPKDEDFSLYLRAYWPQAAITSGQWTPPAVARVR